MNATTKTAPTAQQWAERAMWRPEGVKQILTKAAAIREAAAKEQREREERAQRDAAKRRANFEAAVSLVLREEGAEWLATYRVPDERMPALASTLELGRDAHAVFDAAAIALWPIRLELYAVSVTDDPTDDVWAKGVVPWIVFRPTGQISCVRFESALEIAANYVGD